jgi:hypothetical protein
VILLIPNALYIPSMDHNLLPPFIMRAGGVIINDIPKIHCEYPTDNDHCISFRNHDLHIRLRLIGTFSYFNHHVPTIDELQGCDKLFITPDSSMWNPHCDSFALNEESMVDYNGHINDSNRRSHFIMQPENTDEYGYSVSSISCLLWNQVIDNCSKTSFSFGNISSVQSSSDNNQFTDFADALFTQTEISKFKSSLGSCTISSDNVDLFIVADDASIPSNLDSILSKPIYNSSSLSSTLASPSKGITSKALSKLWCINELQATKVIESTTQLNRQSADNSLSRNFSTNDRMLRYRRLNSIFFTDTMFVTKRAKSTQGYMACQVFVSDKGFVAVYPMQKASNFEDALKLFCKEVGVPMTMVADPHPS